MLYLSLPNLISADGFPLVFSRPSKDVAEYFAHALDLGKHMVVWIAVDVFFLLW